MNDLKEIYGPICRTDSSFAAKARFLRSWFRVNRLHEMEYGVGPDSTSETKFGNILVNGQITGSNFLLPEIFRYAKYRCEFLKKGETIQEYRLFNNMLSSQPMCFNLFFPLKSLFEKDHIAAGEILKTCFPSLNIHRIVDIEIEYLPYPVSEYLNDRTAFDAMVVFSTQTGERNILAIETKYVEKLGINTSSDRTNQMEVVNFCPFFNDLGKQYSKSGFSQLGRNFLLAEKFREVNRLDKAHAVVISPEWNESSVKEIKDFRSFLMDGFQDRLFYTSLKSIITGIRQIIPKSMEAWIRDFDLRYLGNGDVWSLYEKYRQTDV